MIDPLGLLPGDCYPTKDIAAQNALNDINLVSKAFNAEFAGRIYKNSDGTYSYTDPSEGDITSSDPGPLNPNTVGTYHTHGDFWSSANGDALSPADIANAIEDGLSRPGYVSYVATPSDAMLEFNQNSYIGDMQSPDMRLPQFIDSHYFPPGQSIPCSCGN